MWARLLSAALGVWLMAAPAVLGYRGTAAETSDRIVGPIVVSFAVIALWEVSRAVRWVNLLMALWLLSAPAVLGMAPVPLANSVVVGLVLVLLTLVPERKKERFAGGWRALWA